MAVGLSEFLKGSRPNPFILPLGIARTRRFNLRLVRHTAPLFQSARRLSSLARRDLAGFADFVANAI
jgi:hypothetical protein